MPWKASTIDAFLESGVPVGGRSERVDPKTRRSLPEGIRYRADRNEYQVRVRATGLNGEDRERSFLMDTLAEAKKLRSEARKQVRPDGAMSLNAWHARYWPTIESGVRPATARGYDIAWRRRVKPWFGHRKFEAITIGDIEQAIAEWDGTASTRNDALSMLSRLLDGAARAGILEANPARLARRPKDGRARSFRSRAPTADEVTAMLAAVEEGPYRAYLAALVYTGDACRRAERSPSR